jgi:ABC-2 type transport system permease protein
MSKLTSQSICLSRQVLVEIRLFWRNRETVYLTFLIPMLGMALFVYLNREGMLDGVFNVLLRGLGGSHQSLSQLAPIVYMTLGIITYCIVAAAFESPVPKLVRERDTGILKRLGGTPLRGWIFLVAKTLSASSLVAVEVAVILAMGLISSDIDVAGSPWLLATVLMLGIFTVAPLGYILSSVTTSADAAVMAVHAIYIPMLLLCGAFVPVEALPKALQVAAQAFPLTYFVAPFRAVMVDGANLKAITGDLLILAAWLVGGWIVAIKVFRWE